MRRGVRWWSMVLAALVLAGCYPRTRLADPAQKCLECALRRHPDVASLPAAAVRFDEVCGEGDGASCSVLGVMYEQGRGVARDLGRAAKLYDKACEARNAAGCANLGRFFEQGIVGSVDVEGAHLLYEVACDGGHAGGCYDLARLDYRTGRAKQAMSALERGCRGGNAESCEGLGSLYQHGNVVPRSPRRAGAMYQRACRGGLDTACSRLARLR